MENNSAKMARLLGRLKTEMNGAVTDSMREHGITYPLNYGVSVPTIRAIASEYAPDHTLAKLLYQQQVRELKLSAIVIADASFISPEEVAFWAGGIENSEVAEHLASGLLGKTEISDAVVRYIWDSWLSASSDLIKYAALLTLAKHTGSDVKHNIFIIGGGGIQPQLIPVLQSGNKLIWRGLVAFLSRFALSSDENAEQVRLLIGLAEKAGYPSADYIKEELEWQL